MADMGGFSGEESEDSVCEEGINPNTRNKEHRLQNEKYDMALEVSASASLDGDALDEAKTKSGGPKDKSSDEKAKTSKTEEDVKNDQFDATYDLSTDDDSSVDTGGEDMAGTKKRAIGAPSISGNRRTPDAINTVGITSSSVAGLSSSATRAVRQGGHGASDASESDSESSSNDDEDSGPLKIEGAYNPADYTHLNVSAEIKDLFQYIGRYKPHHVDLDTSLRCFVPDFIPAVGDIDAFLKVPRPDNKPDELGFKVLDEPSTEQSDATVLELHLRAISKRQHGDVAVRSIENAQDNPGEIDKWIQSISDLHRTQPPPQVHYKKNMPDVEVLMEAWPPEFEAILGNMDVLTPELDISLEEYARTICAVMDIPVYDNIIESLHLLFTTFMEFKSNAHFVQLGSAERRLGASEEMKYTNFSRK